MQIVSTSLNVSPSTTAKSSRDPIRADVQPVESVDEDLLRDASRDDVPEQAAHIAAVIEDHKQQQDLLQRRWRVRMQQ